MTASAWARTARPTSRSSTSPALRTIPNLLVFRPADAVETAECWAIALKSKHRPSVLALTRQNLPTVRDRARDRNLCAKGGYVLAPAEASARSTHLRHRLRSRRSPSTAAKPCRPRASAPPSSRCRAGSCSTEQDEAYQDEVIGEGTVRIAVEAADRRQGWERYIGRKGAFIGMTSFGDLRSVSGSLQAFRHYCRCVVAAAKARL